jgi:hypothetical protein
MARFKSTTHIGKEQSQTKIRTPGRFARSTPPGGIRARGRRGEGLASARDRQRLRERNMAERDRVEGMIASLPIPVERRAHRRESPGSDYTPDSVSSGLRIAQAAGCPVCGDGRIVTDEVIHRGTLRVSECLHCEHRWTERPKGRWVELGTRMNRSVRPRAIQTAEPALVSQARRPSQRRTGYRTTGETALSG